MFYVGVRDESGKALVEPYQAGRVPGAGEMFTVDGKTFTISDIPPSNEYSAHPVLSGSRMVTWLTGSESKPKKEKGDTSKQVVRG